jgi:DNA invertase Pin-like site-specific DNA recombinase
VLTIADDLHERGVGVRILTGTYTPAGEGKFFFTMMAAFAELERDIIHERTMAGLVAARAQGRGGGRPTVMDEDKLAAVRARRARGESPTRDRRGARCQPGLGLPASGCRRELATTKHASMTTLAAGRRVLERDGWWSLDDPAEYNEMCRWPVIPR